MTKWLFRIDTLLDLIFIILNYAGQFTALPVNHTCINWVRVTVYDSIGQPRWIQQERWLLIALSLRVVFLSTYSYVPLL